MEHETTRITTCLCEEENHDEEKSPEELLARCAQYSSPVPLRTSPVREGRWGGSWLRSEGDVKKVEGGDEEKGLRSEE
eukprot:746888-Hanusia_phi.AAC.9